MRAGYAEVAKYGLLGDAQVFCLARSQLAGRLRQQRPGADEGDRNERRRPRRRSSRATRRKPATGRCSTSAIRSATRSKHGPAIQIACCTAKASRSACAWRSACRRILGICPRGRADRVSKPFESRRPSHQNRRHSGRPCRRRRAVAADGPGQESPRAASSTFILVRDIGQAFVSREVVPETVKAFLGREIAR